MAKDTGKEVEAQEEELDEEAGEEEEDDLVLLVDEDGNELEYRFLSLLEVEGTDYALLTPAEEEEEEAINVFVFAYKVDDDGAEIYDPIEDEGVIAKVQEAFEQMLAEEDEEEDDA